MGRSSLVMVLGFTTALLMLGSNICKVSSSAMDNYLAYYKNAMAHNIAGAGINMASRALEEDKLWTSGFSNKSFAGGVFNVTVTNIGSNQLKVVLNSNVQWLLKRHLRRSPAKLFLKILLLQHYRPEWFLGRR